MPIAENHREKAAHPQRMVPAGQSNSNIVVDPSQGEGGH